MSALNILFKTEASTLDLPLVGPSYPTLSSLIYHNDVFIYLLLFLHCQHIGSPKAMFCLFCSLMCLSQTLRKVSGKYHHVLNKYFVSKWLVPLLIKEKKFRHWDCLQETASSSGKQKHLYVNLKWQSFYVQVDGKTRIRLSNYLETVPERRAAITR